MTPDPAHPLAAATDRLAVFRAVCAILVGGLVMITVLIGVVVRFALDGQPIAGNGVQVAGVSAVTWAALAVAGVAPVVAVAIASSVRTRGLAALAADPAPDAGKLLDVFAAVTFAEFAVAEGAGFACGLLYHLTADVVLLVAVAGLVGFLVARFPTTARAVRWYDEAAAELAMMRDCAAR